MSEKRWIDSYISPQRKKFLTIGQLQLVEETPFQNPNAHVTKSSVRHDWETPPQFFDTLNREFGFTLDVCATPENAKCKEFLTVRENGLAAPWGTNVCWMNPPYGKDLPRWMTKAHDAAHAGATVVCLVPARTHTKWFHRLCLQAEVRFLRGRLRYVGADGGEAPFAQLVIVFRPGLARPWVMKPWEWRPRSKQQLLELEP